MSDPVFEAFSVECEYKRFAEDIYVFKLGEKREIIAARAPLCALHIGEDPLSGINIPSVETWLETEGVDIGQGRLETKEGRLVIFPFAASSTALGLAVVERMGEYALPPLFESISDRNRKYMPRTPKELIKAIAALAGIPLKVQTRMGDGDWNDDVDMGVFISFMLVLLLFVRRTSDTRSADVFIDRDRDLGVSVKIELPITDPGNMDIGELIALDSIAQSKNIFFDYAIHDDCACVGFSPIPLDKIFIELKAGDEFIWDS